VEGPDTLLVGQTGYYRMYMTGGPAEAGGYNVAGRFGEMQLVDSFSTKHPLSPNELTQAFSLPFPTTQDTIYWAFGYTASDTSAAWDTIYSCGLSLVWDSIPDPFDRWNFGPKFAVKIETLTDVNENLMAENFLLYQNYPNPFNPTTKIKFTIPTLPVRQAGSPLNPSPYQGEGNRERFVSLKVYDAIGNEVSTLLNKELGAGKYEFEFDGNRLPSGVYFYQFKATPKGGAEGYVETKKMLLLK
jgi:hypothetical protein